MAGLPGEPEAEYELQGGPDDGRLALRQAGITLLIVEQNLSFARRCTSRLYVIAQRTVRYSGGWAEFAMTPDLLESYL
jgi:branched-chain amino acid transport system ATP-binding protein